MSKINTTVHDNFIRAILADKEIAVEYFSNYLPSSVTEHLDFSTLTQIPDTYISKNLHKTMSDIVYSCRMNGKDKWKYGTLSDLFSNLPSEWQKYLPNFDYVIIIWV